MMAYQMDVQQLVFLKHLQFEIMEQKFPVLYNHYSLHDKSSGAGEFRGGFGLDYEIEILCKEATASFVMDLSLIHI